MISDMISGSKTEAAADTTMPTNEISGENVTEETVVPQEETQEITGQYENMYAGMLNSVAKEPSIVGKVFTGLYLALFGWLLMHTLLYFWDILIPWNISIGTHFYFNGAFMTFIVLIAIIVWMVWSIWSIPSWSTTDSTRWTLGLLGNLAVIFLWFSNMSGEPMEVIGSSWIGEDLRYPVFLTQNYIFSLSIFFVNDFTAVFRTADAASGTSFLFRPYFDRRFNDAYMGFRENLYGICCCAFIYASYWVTFFVITRSWIERIVIYISIYFLRSSFGSPKVFTSYRKFLILLLVPICALTRAYYSYLEWKSHGPRLSFALKLLYCLIQLTIFAGWYSDPASQLAKYTMPFISTSEVVSDEKEIEDAEAKESDEPKETDELKED